MTMVVELPVKIPFFISWFKSCSIVSNDSGQSLFEFLLMLPMLFGMSIILIKINTAIQISIVDQQYARGQVLFLAFNSPYYPNMDMQLSQLIGKSINQMIVGVSDNAADTDNYTPKATVQQISRKKNSGASDENQTEPAARSNVRIRNSVTLCTQTLFLTSGTGGATPIMSWSGSIQKQINVNGNVNLSEQNAIGMFQHICGSNVKYEQ